MNILTSLFSTHLPRPQNRGSVVPPAPRPVRRERGLGTGYGSSSGYAAAVPYARTQGPAYFRFG